jgi:hypothetical protein
MKVTGDLRQARPGDLLKVLATLELSGRLRLSHAPHEGIVLFNRGRVLYAATSAVRETLGSILVARDLIDGEQLVSALARQKEVDDQRLGAILVESGVVSREIVDSALAEQIRAALTELLSWPGGRYEFRPSSAADEGDALVDVLELIREDHLGPDEVTAELEARFESTSGSRAATAVDPPSRLALLKRTASEIRSPQFTGELVVKILDFARQTVGRAVLFLVRPEGFQGMGHVGVEIPDVNVNQAVRSLVVPFDRPSLLLEAADRKQAVLRPIADDGRDDSIVRGLGGDVPGSALAVPMVVDERVMTVLYVDNLPGDEAIQPIDELELLMIQAGMSVEKNLYRRRLEQYETLRNLDRDEEVDA